MSMDKILSGIRTFDGLLELAPQPGDGSPEMAWGDHFFYYAPDGAVPTNRQPYATIVTKNYPDDVASDLDHLDRWRLNIHVGKSLAAELTGTSDGSDRRTTDSSAQDVFMHHPLYGEYGWVSVVNPSTKTLAKALAALRQAHDDDRRRVERRRADH